MSTLAPPLQCSTMACPLQSLIKSSVPPFLLFSPWNTSDPEEGLGLVSLSKVGCGGTEGVAVRAREGVGVDLWSWQRPGGWRAAAQMEASQLPAAHQWSPG